MFYHPFSSFYFNPGFCVLSLFFSFKYESRWRLINPQWCTFFWNNDNKNKKQKYNTIIILRLRGMRDKLYEREAPPGIQSVYCQTCLRRQSSVLVFVWGMYVPPKQNCSLLHFGGLEMEMLTRRLQRHIIIPWRPDTSYIYLPFVCLRRYTRQCLVRS